MSIFVCGVCGHVEFGSAPDSCPVCHVPKENFKQNDSVFTDAMEKSKEGAVKHVPVVTVKKECKMVPENLCTDVLVRVGEVLHPMEEKHFIQFIDCYLDDTYVGRASLSPGANPAVIFHVKDGGKKIRVVEFCNLHGHWQAEAEI